jgi:ribosomal protein S18 acetylase RimI-like enzyme
MEVQMQASFTAECMVPNGLKYKDVEALNRLLAEFSPRALPPPFHVWREMTDKNFLFVALTQEREIVGMATLVINCIPTGRIGLVEDVIVARAARGQGAGRGLVQLLIETARAHKLKRIDLTSRRSRIEANSLYQKLGFEYRDTNNYRLTL